MKNLKFLRSRSNFAFPFANLLGKKSLMNIRQNTSVCNGNRSQKLAELLIIPYRKLNVPRNNTVLLVVPRSIPSQFQNLIDTKHKKLNLSSQKTLEFTFITINQPKGQNETEKIQKTKQTSAARYSSTAERYTGAPAPTRSAYFPALRNLAILPTGN